MSKERLYLFDTTLRDGAQMHGVDFTLADKLKVMRHARRSRRRLRRGRLSRRQPDRHRAVRREAPDQSQVHRLRHDQAARPLRVERSRCSPRCSPPKPTRSASSAKSSAFQVRVALEIAPEENLASIREFVAAAKASGREVLFDCEHFFDGYKDDRDYALACAKAAYDAGARWVVLCDTNGGTLPHEVEEIVARGRQAGSRRPPRHPRPQRHRAGGGELARRRARRRPPDPGHAERPRRALRQRQPRAPSSRRCCSSRTSPAASRSKRGAGRPRRTHPGLAARSTRC